MNELVRTVHDIIESDLNHLTLCQGKGKKAFQLVKHTTGKQLSTLNDYTVESVDRWHGYDTLLIRGQKGFIRVALTPLFEIVE